MVKNILRKSYGIFEYVHLSYLLEKNEILRNKHVGKKIFLFATGTSLLGTDLSKFNNEITIGCNDIFRHPSFSSLNLKYYIAAVPYRRWRELGPRFTHAHHHQYFLNVHEAFHGRDTEHLYHATMHKYLSRRDLLSGVSRYYFLRNNSLVGANDISVDLTKPASWFDGGFSAMISLAMFMGCKEIYLFGCGRTYSPIQAFHFYDCMRCPVEIYKEGLESEMRSFQLSHPECDFSLMKANNITLNDKESLIDFSHYENAEEGHQDDFYKAHRIIREYADSNGVRIFNVVPNGYDSPVYEKFDINNIC